MSELYLLHPEPRPEMVVVQVPEVPTAVVSVVDYPLDEMSTLFDRGFSALFPALAAAGITPVGPAFSLHYRMPTATGVSARSPVRAARSGRSRPSTSLARRAGANLRTHADSLDRATCYVVTPEGGIRSELAVHLLNQLGFDAYLLGDEQSAAA